MGVQNNAVLTVGQPKSACLTETRLGDYPANRNL